MYPGLGKAGSSYARTVKPMTLVPGARPDAETVFNGIHVFDLSLKLAADYVKPCLRATK